MYFEQQPKKRRSVSIRTDYLEEMLEASEYYETSLSKIVQMAWEIYKQNPESKRLPPHLIKGYHEGIAFALKRVESILDGNLFDAYSATLSYQDALELEVAKLRDELQEILSKESDTEEPRHGAI